MQTKQTETTPKGHGKPELLKAFQSGNGAHCGLTDWYPDKEKALKRAIRSGKPFDTGWYGSKKEIASARIYSMDGKTVQVEASVSDDFDTYGNGAAQVFGAAPVSLEQVQQAIYRAWDEAENNQKDNREYAGFSILRKTRRYGCYVGGKPVGKSSVGESWVETLILPIGDFPSDSYCRKTQLKSLTVGKWTIKPWEDE
jgi:hypothetical protein